MCICICVYIYIYMYTYIWCVCMCVYIYIYNGLSLSLSLSIYIYIYIYIYIPLLCERSAPLIRAVCLQLSRSVVERDYLTTQEILTTCGRVFPDLCSPQPEIQARVDPASETRFAFLWARSPNALYIYIYIYMHT